MQACFICGSNEKLIKHHICYDPETIVECCHSCHCKIHKHRKKDRTGLMVVSRDDLKLSHKGSTKRYHDRTTRRIEFRDGRLNETIRYNNITGNISYSSRFDIRYGHDHIKKLPIVEV